MQYIFYIHDLTSKSSSFHAVLLNKKLTQHLSTCHPSTLALVRHEAHLVHPSENLHHPHNPNLKGADLEFDSEDDQQSGCFHDRIFCLEEWRKTKN